MCPDRKIIQYFAIILFPFCLFYDIITYVKGELNMNKAILIGNLTNDPEVKTTSNGINYCRFTLAVSRNYAGKDGKRER